jgi:5'-3' exonuclease
MKYALIDTANTFFRARHVASRNSNTWEKIGMALHLTFASVNQVVRKFGIDHVVFCLEGRSWRREFYKPYKAQREVLLQAMTEAEVEENKVFWDTYNALTEFLYVKTNVSVLQHEKAEADDLIARFIHLHPNDLHYIISSDSDYLQLISDNVSQYNGVSKQFVTKQGYLDEKDRLIVDKKTKKPKLLGDPEFILFEKCMRGDSGDNVFSAYPGVRSKGTKNKVGLDEAFEDRHKKGFKWNNMMLQKWVDHEGVEHKVRDDYERNVKLIDLKAQPDDIKRSMDAKIVQDLRIDHVPNIGFHWMKFCGKYELVKLSENPDMIKWLNRPYDGAMREAAKEAA